MSVKIELYLPQSFESIEADVEQGTTIEALVDKIRNGTLWANAATASNATSPDGVNNVDAANIATSPDAANIADIATATLPHDAVALQVPPQQQLPYTVLAAKVNGRLKQLDYHIGSPAVVKLLDTRNSLADRLYQNSLTLIYLVAVQKVLGTGSDARIYNALNRGLYTELRHSLLAGKDAAAIYNHMRDIVARNLPITEISRRGAMIEYGLDGLTFSLFGKTVTRTGYIEKFELRPYENGILLRYPHQRDPDVLPAYYDDYKLGDAYSQLRSWLVKHGLNFASDLNEIIVAGREKDLIKISEDIHRKWISKIATDIVIKSRQVVLISGPSSSGKTTFSMRLMAQIEALEGDVPLYIGTDDYFLDRKDTPRGPDGEPNYEGLEAIDRAMLADHIARLVAGEEVDLPTFDFIEGKKIFGKRITKLHADQVVVIEGIHALNDSLTEQMDASLKYRIYISPLVQSGIDNHNRIPTTDLRLMRRMVRDHRTRGKSAADTIHEWPKVRAGEEVNVFPYNAAADAVFNTASPYELCALKKYAIPLLETIAEGTDEYQLAKNLRDMLSFFTPIVDDSVIPKNSIIREFIGGGYI
ncbi:MAG: nucleoside kinase [Clostridiales Family XIII bacterium]|jgi:uridine kinase|nr:nucleoside kinase [Clostridiales Family XIII bacterium]